ncbi:hypothetical protein NDU88_006019 [Pleurodeles waltl]|uniref:Uncharacterized protein n=1 Tax=Pleurodeles waltl TaxID=8319 RepID=A0AAV7SNC7_PLEWA|nr:hypothetical protein NDU88_006019 [Pleurodeles waltl]
MYCLVSEAATKCPAQLPGGKKTAAHLMARKTAGKDCPGLEKKRYEWEVWKPPEGAAIFVCSVDPLPAKYCR